MKNEMHFATCCFTGHRPRNLPWGSNEQNPRCMRLKALLRQEIQRLITENGVTHFISGMDIGTDLIAAQTVAELKRETPHITLESAIPHENQAIDWTNAQREIYYDIARRCDTETMLRRAYSPDCFQKRNQYMVSHSAFVIAVWNGTPSGTGQTVMLARESKRSLTIINPDTLEVRRMAAKNPETAVSGFFVRLVSFKMVRFSRGFIWIFEVPYRHSQRVLP